MTSFPNMKRFRANDRLVTDQSNLIVEMLRKPKKYKVLGYESNRASQTIEIMDRKTRVRKTFSMADFQRAKAQIAGW